MSDFGVNSMVGRLRRAIVCAPNAFIGTVEPALWHYASRINFERAASEFSEFTSLLVRYGCELISLDDADVPSLVDAVFAHDASIVTRYGAIMARMGKPLRQGEERLHAQCYRRLGVPILGAIEEPGTLEAGDCLWVGDEILAVGRGFRTNSSGIEQLRSILVPLGIEVVPFDLPVYRGKAACLHLMSIVSFLDRDLALIARPLLPVGLSQLFEECGIKQIDAPWDEFEASNTISANILAMAPRVCVMVDSFPKTRAVVEELGCQVECFRGEELCMKAEGGPTCLTRPLWRIAEAGNPAGGR